MKYLPVQDADDSCQNNICQCGATGRVALKVSGAVRRLEEWGPSPGFGLHTVLAAGEGNSRARASGNMSVSDVETIFDAKWASALAKGHEGTTEPWLDYHTALYVPTLAPYTTAFKADNVEYLPFSFNSSAHPAPTPALYVHIPKTQVIFVLAAMTVGDGDDDAHWTDGSLRVEQLDLSGYGGRFPDVPEGFAHPLYESRAVASIDQMTDFCESPSPPSVRNAISV